MGTMDEIREPSQPRTRTDSEGLPVFRWSVNNYPSDLGENSVSSAGKVLRLVTGACEVLHVHEHENKHKVLVNTVRTLILEKVVTLVS